MKNEILRILKCIRQVIINKSSKNQYRKVELEVDANIKGFKLIFKSKKNDITDQR